MDPILDNLKPEANNAPDLKSVLGARSSSEPLPNPDDLIYKTMPRNGNAANFIPRKPVPAPAPAPVPVPEPAGMPTPAPVAPVSPIPTSHIAVTQPAHADKILDEDFELHAPKRHIRKPVIIGIVLLLLAVGGYIAYSYFGSKETTKEIDAPVIVSEISSEWLEKYFGSATCADQQVCGDTADPDRDGLSNLEEYKLGSDPNNADSDADQIADGDEKNIFGSNPLNNHTSGNMKFSDTEDIKTMWNSAAGRKYNDSELLTIAANIKAYGLHVPTTTTLGAEIIAAYSNFKTEAESQPANETVKPGALDRDTQRIDTINKIGAALFKYKETNKKYPVVATFNEMIEAIKPLIVTQALNITDPTNEEPYLYKYQAVAAGLDFKLSYFSETVNQLVSINEATVIKTQSEAQITQRDTKRKDDLEQLSGALELYANDNPDPEDPTRGLFPEQGSWKADLQGAYLETIPVDPLSGKDYVYTVSSDRTTFALQAELEKAPTGKRGYLCTMEACGYY